MRNILLLQEWNRIKISQSPKHSADYSSNRLLGQPRFSTELANTWIHFLGREENGTRKKQRVRKRKVDQILSKTLEINTINLL